MNTSNVQYRPFTINVPQMDVRRFKTIAKAMDWVVLPIPTAMAEALDDIRNGRVYHAESVEDMFNQILG